MDINLISKDEYLVLETRSIVEVSSGTIFFVSEGRNAWHSTWVKTYGAGCMHETFEAASEYAEKRRKSGSVFYIQELPCLIFRTTTRCYLFTEINTDNPLRSFLSSQDDTVTSMKDVADFFDSSIYILLGRSRFDSVLALSAEYIIEMHECFQRDFLEYVSFSNGSGYRLGWYEKDSDISFNAVETLRSRFESYALPSDLL